MNYDNYNLTPFMELFASIYQTNINALYTYGFMRFILTLFVVGVGLTLVIKFIKNRSTQ